MEELDKNNKNENYYSYSGRQTSSKKSMETQTIGLRRWKGGGYVSGIGSHLFL